MVADYLSRQPDPEYSARAAQALIEEYQRLINAGIQDPDEIFWQLVVYVSSNDLKDHKKMWAALGIVSHYFELCDIFER